MKEFIIRTNGYSYQVYQRKAPRGIMKLFKKTKISLLATELDSLSQAKEWVFKHSMGIAQDGIKREEPPQQGGDLVVKVNMEGGPGMVNYEEIPTEQTPPESQEKSLSGQSREEV
jgi:hypothetical protein